MNVFIIIISIMTTQPLTSDSHIFPHDITYLECAAQPYSFPSTHINKHGILLCLLPCGWGRWTPDRGNGSCWCKLRGTIASLYAALYAISWWSRSSIVWIFLQWQSSTETHPHDNHVLWLSPLQKKRSAHCGRTIYQEDDQFNQILSLAIQQSIQSETKVDTELASTCCMVDLMWAFNDAKAMIGDRVSH